MNETATLMRIVECDHARRELLWLRAKEKDDVASLRDVERVDPSVVDRLRAAGVDVSDHEGETPRKRRERFGRLFDECYERHARRLEEERERVSASRWAAPRSTAGSPSRRRSRRG